MSELTTFLHGYGHWVFLGLGFAEFAGLPIASVPLLIAAGALATLGVGPSPSDVVLLAALGGWVADAIWYGIGRWRGERIMDLACGLSSNPGACALRVSSRLEQVGPTYIAVSKFVPGAGNLVASAAGMVRFPALLFLGMDAAALLAWAGAWVLLGSWLGEPVEAVVRTALTWIGPLLGAVAGLIVLGLVWRAVKVRRHRAAHEAARITAADAVEA